MPPGDGDTIALAEGGISSRTVTLSFELIRLIESVDLDDYFVNVPMRRHIRKILDEFSDYEFEFFCMIYAKRLQSNWDAQ